MLYFPLINVKMPTIVGILTLMSRKNFMLSCVEHEKSFITSGPDLALASQIIYQPTRNNHINVSINPDNINCTKKNISIFDLSVSFNIENNISIIEKATEKLQITQKTTKKNQNRPRGYKTFSCSTQLSMKF